MSFCDVTFPSDIIGRVWSWLYKVLILALSIFNHSISPFVLKMFQPGCFKGVCSSWQPGKHRDIISAYNYKLIKWAFGLSRLKCYACIVNLPSESKYIKSFAAWIRSVISPKHQSLIVILVYPAAFEIYIYGYSKLYCLGIGRKVLPIYVIKGKICNFVNITPFSAL